MKLRQDVATRPRGGGAPRRGHPSMGRRAAGSPSPRRTPECTATSHPFANTPRWSTLRAAFPIERVYVGESLASLAAALPEVPVRVVRRVRSPAQLAREVNGCACVLEPAWVCEGGWTLDEVAALARLSWLLIDLRTFARLARFGRAGRARLLRLSSRVPLAARVVDSDVQTRGMALQDVVPYSFVADGGFAVDALESSPERLRRAAQRGQRPLLTTDGPRALDDGHVLSLACSCGPGAWTATDLPWLVAGARGRLAASRVARHLLRMHLALPLEDDVQFWTRGADARVALRDLADMEKRYAGLRAVRWASAGGGVAPLGLALLAGAPRQTLMIRSGRIDLPAGVPPEPMAIFMRRLARDVVEGTAWARRHLAQRAVVWQFESGDGLRYATHFDAAPATLDANPLAIVELRPAPGGAPRDATAPSAGPTHRRGGGVIEVDFDADPFGDGSIDVQRALNRALRSWIERVDVAM